MILTFKSILALRPRSDFVTLITKVVHEILLLLWVYILRISCNIFKQVNLVKNNLEIYGIVDHHCFTPPPPPPPLFFSS